MQRLGERSQQSQDTTRTPVRIYDKMQFFVVCAYGDFIIVLCVSCVTFAVVVVMFVVAGQVLRYVAMTLKVSRLSS